MRSKRFLVAAAMAVTASLVAAACGSDSESGGSAPAPVLTNAPATAASTGGTDTTDAATGVTTASSVTEVTDAIDKAQDGGTLRVVLPKTIITLDPQFAFDSYSVLVLDQIFDTLVTVDDGGNIVPRLATSWTANDNGTQWDFVIRDGVVFQNGRAMTVDDVVYTMNRMIDPATAVPRQQLDMVKSVEAVDKTTVRFTLNKPYSPFLNRLAHRALSIVPKEEIEAKGQEGFAKDPVGTGPFKFVSWDLDTVTLAANPDYFFGAPHLDGVVFKPVPETTVAQQQLETGDVDVLLDVLPDDVGRLQADGLLKASPGLSYYYIVFNEEPTKAPIAAQLGTNPFTDVKVREAISLSFDVAGADEAVYPGLGSTIQAFGPVPNANWAYNADLAASAPKPDVEKAKQLLADAGYPDGFDVNLLVMNDAARQAIGQIFQNSLAQIGINATIESPEFSVLLAKANAQTFDIGVFGWSGSPDPHEYLYPLLHSDSRGPGGNNAYYSNPEVDKLLDDAVATPDQDARKAMYDRVQQIVADDFVHIPLFYKASMLATQPAVNDLELDPFGFIHLVTADANVWLAS